MTTRRRTSCPNISTATARRPKPFTDFMAISESNQKESQLTRSSARTFTHSEAKMAQAQQRKNSSRGGGGGGGRPVWSMTSLMDALPGTPSPICSGGSSSPLGSAAFSSPPNELYCEDGPTKFSSPRILSSLNQSDAIKSDGIHQWIESNRNFRGLNQSCSPIRCLSMSSRYESALQTIAELKEEADASIYEENHLQGFPHSYGEATGAQRPNNGHDKLTTRPKPYHTFLNEVKTQELEAEIDAWKRAKHEELMTRLTRKEAAISDWEFRQMVKAMKERKKLECKLERSRAQVQKRTQKQIDRAKEVANKKKAKARESTVKKISRVTEISNKIRATPKSIWLKLVMFVHN